MDRKFLQFIPKVLLFGLPFILLALSYFVFDPFHVLRNYQHYGSNYLKTYNRNRISTQTYLNYKDKENFDSFLFGSSRASAFQTQDWAKYLPGAKPFHFDAFNDNISGIRGKLAYIDKNGSPVKNALIIIDADTFSEQYEESESIVHHKDYRWTDEWPISYHARFFKAYFKKKYFLSYLDLKIFNTYRPSYMDEFFKFKYYYTSPENDFLFPENIEKIQQDSIKYYQDPEFFSRKPKPAMMERQIKTHHLADLRTIDSLFTAHKTDYKIILGPNFDQRDYNPIDLDILSIFFGKKNLYNFTGKNYITDDISNYYEISHYKPVAGQKILKEIYGNTEEKK